MDYLLQLLLVILFFLLLFFLVFVLMILENLKIFLEILVEDNQGEEEKPTIEALICDMIYLLLLKKLMRVKNRI